MRIASSNILHRVHPLNASFVQFSHHWGPLGRPVRCHKDFKRQFQSQSPNKNRNLHKSYQYKHNGLIHSKEMWDCKLWF